MTKYLILFLVLSGLCSTVFSQNRDIANIGYIYIGKGSGNNNSELGFEKFYTSVNVPLKVKKGAIFNSITYSSVHIDYSTSPEYEAIADKFNDFYSVSYGLGYFRALSPKWKMMVRLQPTVSGLQHEKVNFKSFNMFCTALLMHPLKNNVNLTLGLSYSTITGIPAPIPVVTFSWDSPSKKWHYDIGIPRMNIKYRPTKKLEFETSMLMSGEYYNIDGKLTFKAADGVTDIKPEDIRINNMAAGIKCRYKLYKMLKIQADLGYTFRRKYEFLVDNDAVVDFDLTNDIYTGIKISLGI